MSRTPNPIFDVGHRVVVKDNTTYDHDVTPENELDYMAGHFGHVVGQSAATGAYEVQLHGRIDGKDSYGYLLNSTWHFWPEELEHAD